MSEPARYCGICEQSVVGARFVRHGDGWRHTFCTPDPKATPTEGGGLCIEGGPFRHVQLSAAEVAVAFRALIAQADGVETKAVRRSHGTIVPAGAVPMPGDKIIPALLLPMEGSE